MDINESIVVASLSLSEWEVFSYSFRKSLKIHVLRILERLLTVSGTYRYVFAFFLSQCLKKHFHNNIFVYKDLFFFVFRYRKLENSHKQSYSSF